MNGRRQAASPKAIVPLLFAYHFLAAKLRRRWFELSPESYRRFHLALALPRWRRFPFYRGAGRFENFPVIRKTDMLAGFAALNAFGASYESCLEAGLAQERSRDFLTQNKLPYAIGLSSGTSGRRGVFLTTESERVRWAATIIAHADFIPFLKPQKLAFFLRSNSPLYETAGTRRLDFRFFDLAAGFPELWEKLKEFRPTVLMGPPALLAEVRRAEEREGKHLEPQVVVSVADKLERDERSRLENHFGRRIFEVYQATEGFLAISCAHGTLHLNEDLHLFERAWTDDSHTAFEPVISDYFRSSQAFVRYRLDDVLVPQPACACGSRRQAIREIRGRADDVLFFTDRAGLPVSVLPDFVRHAIQNQLQSDLDFQVVQEGSRLRIMLEKEPGAEALAQASKALREHLASRNIEPPSLDWSFGLRRPLGDKRKRVIRHG
jgi:putative adenylate-forming enzyme